jgi:addiction module HigA family antidote
MAREMRLPKHRPPTLPGKILAEEFMEPLGLTVTAFAKHIGVGRDRMSFVMNALRSIVLRNRLLTGIRQSSER